MKLIEIVIHAFESIIKKYNLQSSIISEEEVVLFSDKYILSFLRHSGELQMVYIEKKEDGDLYAYYNIDSFIANSVSDEARMQIKERLKRESKTEIHLTLIAYTLEKKWDDLLLGGKEWIKEYQNFLLYIPPRNVTQLLEKRYKGKCI